MARPQTRACFQDGLRLDINQLIRSGYVIPGAAVGPFTYHWVDYLNDETASGLITSDLATLDGWVRIQMDDLDQRLALERQPRHYGGGQWYFFCYFAPCRRSVVWKPLGAGHFASRQAWGNQVAYRSQIQPQFMGY